MNMEIERMSLHAMVKAFNAVTGGATRTDRMHRPHRGGPSRPKAWFLKPTMAASVTALVAGFAGSAALSLPAAAASGITPPPRAGACHHSWDPLYQWL